MIIISGQWCCYKRKICRITLKFLGSAPCEAFRVPAGCKMAIISTSTIFFGARPFLIYDFPVVSNSKVEGVPIF